MDKILDIMEVDGGLGFEPEDANLLKLKAILKLQTMREAFTWLYKLEWLPPSIVSLQDLTPNEPMPYTLVGRKGICVAITSLGQTSTYLCRRLKIGEKIYATKVGSPLSRVVTLFCHFEVPKTVPRNSTLNGNF